MEDYRLTTEDGKVLLYTVKSAVTAKWMAEQDGYKIKMVEKYEIGYWKVIIGTLTEGK